MKKKLRDSLRTMASIEKARHAEGMSFFTPVDLAGRDLDPMRRLVEGSGMEVVDQASPVLGTLFVPQANAWLKAMPNLYWFWALVEQSVIEQEKLGAGEDDSRISERALRNAMQHFRHTVGAGHDCDTGRELTPGDTMTRIAAGIMTVERTGDVHQPKLRTTPMFTSSRIRAYRS